MTRPCVTHHFGCDCREARFAELERMLAEADSVIAGLHGKAWEKIRVLPVVQSCIERHREREGRDV